MVTYSTPLGNEIIGSLSVKQKIDSGIGKIAKDLKEEVRYIQQDFANVGKSFMDEGRTTEELMFLRLDQYSGRFLYEVSPGEYRNVCAVIEKSGYKGENKIVLNMSIMRYILDRAIEEGMFDPETEKYLDKAMGVIGCSKQGA